MECKHFGRCGGCRCEVGPSGQANPLPYDQELRQKEERVKQLLAPFDIAEWRPTVPSPQEWHYRNKMEYAFAVPSPYPLPGERAQGEGLVLGLRETGHYDRVVDIETCGLMSEEAVEILQRVRRWAQESGLQGYHRRRHEGDLRYLVIREGKNTGERMAVLLATSAGAARCNLKNLEALKPLVSTCWLGVTDSQSDVARADDMRLLWGPGAITEKLISRSYQISPYSFFQTNTRGTEKLYALLQTWGDASGGALIDLYCGSGGITLALADHFDRVIGIDSNAGAIEDAKRAALANGIQNAEFVCEDALEFLKKLPGSKLSIQLSAMIVDPPRAGLPPKALQALLEMNPARLAYVSCNPESLARDLQPLAPFYRIASAQVVDLFPHTAHVETLCLMEHR